MQGAGKRQGQVATNRNFFFYFFAWWEGKVASKLRWNVETLFAGGDESKPRDRYLDVAAARKEGGRQK